MVWHQSVKIAKAWLNQNIKALKVGLIKMVYLTATLIFNPCPRLRMTMVDKLIVFEGNLDKKKLSGMYDDIKLYFYLVKK